MTEWFVVNEIDVIVRQQASQVVETRLGGRPLNTDDAERDRIIDEALSVALMSTRLLVAWHSGNTDAQDSMHNLWEGFCKIRSASEPRLKCHESQPSSHNAAAAPCYGRIRPSGPRDR
jgi:hypothetical protein